MAGIKKIGPDELNVIISFGGGLHTRASPDDIDARECADGYNFLLDLENHDLKPRPPFDLIGTVPNALPIHGGGSLLTSDGAVSSLIQAGDTVYQWNGGNSFTSRGTVSSSAKLRGHWRTQNWTLGTSVLLLTDLNLQEVVKKWDGTTFADVAFTNQAGGAFGTFFAKYLNISNERAVFSNCRDPGSLNHHMIVGCKRGDYTIITIVNRPSSARSEEDPFFLLSPDLKPINGHVEAFGTAIISTERGQLFNLSGQSAKDFAFDPFFPGSGSFGAESMAYIGNDVIYGRQGRVESVTDTQKFGDSENDDLTKMVQNVVKSYNSWLTVYNSRINRVYLFPNQPDTVGSGIVVPPQPAASEVWVLDTVLRGGELSPWMRWKTAHAMAFNPTFVMSMLDPTDGLEYVLMGDATGKLYRMEGTGASGDGGTASISVEWLTKTFVGKLDSMLFDGQGYVRHYIPAAGANLQLDFEHAGDRQFTETTTVALAAGSTITGGSGNVVRRLSRQKFDVTGQANEFQVRAKITTNQSFAINSIGLRLKGASG